MLKRSYVSPALALAALSSTLLPTRALGWSEDADGFIYEVYFPSGDAPLTPADQANYCSAMQEASRSLWQATNGSHHLHTAHFYYGVTPPSGNWDINWTRSHGTPSAGFRVNMYDYLTTCSKQWFTDDASSLDAGVYCKRGVSCQLGPCDSPPCEDYEQIRQSRCLDEDGNTIPRTPDELGWVLAHEVSHSIYDLNDEYVLDGNADAIRRNAYVCAGQYDNEGLEGTSMMGAWGRTHWCDADTHVGTRILHNLDDEQLLDPMGTPYTVSTGAHAGGVWATNFANAGQFEHTYNYNLATKYTSVPPYPSTPFRCEWHFADGAGPIHDALVIVDESGSMGYKHPLIINGPTALASAADAAVSYYNQALPDRMSGIMTFDTSTNMVVPYAPRGSTTLGPLGLTPGGATDLCMAIREGAQKVRDELGTTVSSGAQLLLTDGLPTTADCNSDAHVLAAAQEACEANPIPVATYTLGFGDADQDLLRRVSEVCGAGLSRTLAVTSVPTPGGASEMTVPLHVQAGIARQGRAARALHEALAEERVLTHDNVQPFWVAKGANELSVEFIGDGFVGGTEKDRKACQFDKLKFALVRPDGVLVTTSARPVSTEHSYRTRTLYVKEPMAGRWEARIFTDKDYPCVADAQLPHPWGNYDPRVFTIASFQKPALELELEVLPGRIASDGSASLRAALHDSAQNARVTGGSVKAQVSRATFSETVKLYDDGAHGDEAKEDGVYGGTFNEGHVGLAPGAYRVELAFSTLTGSLGLFGTGDQAFEPGAPMSGHVDPLVLHAEKSLVVQSCKQSGRGACERDRAIPENPKSKDPCTFTLEPGKTYRDLTVLTVGLALGKKPPYVSLGVDVDVGNVRHSYDPKSRHGKVTFDAKVQKHADVDPRFVHVASGRFKVSSEACLVSEEKQAGQLTPRK